MIRETSPDALAEKMDPYADETAGFYPREWILDDRHVALREGDSYGLFQQDLPGVYIGHYFFTVKGKEAMALARKMIDEIFSKHDCRLLIGLTPVEKRHAAWMTRQLGFKSYGKIEWDGKEVELFQMTKDEWEA